MGRKHKSKRQIEPDTTEADKAIPKSIIIYRGETVPEVRQLMQEWRRALSPWSSLRLKAKQNLLRDFQGIASTLSVSHLQLFTSPATGTQLRILRFPRGPTLLFHILSFALRTDLDARFLGPANGLPYNTAPAVILNNFGNAKKLPHMNLLENTFGSLFPPLNVHITKPEDIQRVVLFHYNTDSDSAEVRHYFILRRPSDISRTVKRLISGKVPSRFKDLESVEEVLDKEEAWSDTDGEGEEVMLPQPSRAYGKQCRLKLQEIGPRMTLRLAKIESGFSDGEVLYHHRVSKPAKEVLLASERVRQRTNLKRQRRTQQEANQARKREETEPKKRSRSRSMNTRKEDDSFETVPQ